MHSSNTIKHYKPSSEQAFLVFLHAWNIHEFR